MATTNYSYLPTVSMILADTVTVLQDHVLVLDTSDTTGETLTTTTSADDKAFFIAKENCGSSTSGENAKVRYEFYAMGPIVYLNCAGAVTINTLAASTTTAGLVSTCTGAAGDYGVGLFLETKTAAGKVKVMLMPGHVGATS